MLQRTTTSFAAVHGAARALGLPETALAPLTPAIVAGALPERLVVGSGFELSVELGLSPAIARALGLDAWQDFDAVQRRAAGWSLVARGARGPARVRMMLIAHGLGLGAVNQAEAWLRFLGTGGADFVAVEDRYTVCVHVPTGTTGEMTDALAKAQALTEELELGARARLALTRLFPLFATGRTTLVGVGQDADGGAPCLELRHGGAVWDELLAVWPLFGGADVFRAPRVLGAVAGAARSSRVQTVVLRFWPERISGEIELVPGS